jgi:hypothetical protein
MFMLYGTLSGSATKILEKVGIWGYFQSLNELFSKLIISTVAVGHNTCTHCSVVTRLSIRSAPFAVLSLVAYYIDVLAA